MSQQTVADVMTRDVVRVAPDTPYKDVVDFVVGEEIGAVPVVDRRGGLVGVVSEADLLCKRELSRLAGSRPGHWSRTERRKAAALTARELMSASVITVAPDVSLTEAARRLMRSGRRGLFVVDGGRLVGVVARRDLLRGFLRGDADIRREVERDLLGAGLANPGAVRVTVEAGTVWLTGRVEWQGDVEVAERLSRRVAGVVGVRNRLDYVWRGAGPHAAAGG